jgi:hypothetical protein
MAYPLQVVFTQSSLTRCLDLAGESNLNSWELDWEVDIEEKRVKALCYLDLALGQ